MEEKFNTKKTLEVKLFDDDSLEIESELHKGVSLDIKRIDTTNLNAPDDALYLIRVYESKEGLRNFPAEYDFAYVMKDGSIRKSREE